MFRDTSLLPPPTRMLTGATCCQLLKQKPLLFRHASSVSADNDTSYSGEYTYNAYTYLCHVNFQSL